jgi:hypothetical protein
MRRVTIIASASGNDNTTRTHVALRRSWPHELAGYPVVRLRTAGQVRSFLEQAGR